MYSVLTFQVREKTDTCGESEFHFKCKLSDDMTSS